MPALQQMFSLPLASGRPGARGRRVGGGDLWLRELSLGLSARGQQRSSVLIHSFQILPCTFGRSTNSLRTAGGRLQRTSLLPKGFGGVLAHQNRLGVGEWRRNHPGAARERALKGQEVALQPRLPDLANPAGSGVLRAFGHKLLPE